MKFKWWYVPLVSFVLSLIGIWHGLPMHVVGDEESLIGGALKMIEIRTLIPAFHPQVFSFLYYPPLISYLILIAIVPAVLVKFVLLGFSARAVQDYFALNQNTLWISARILSAVFAAGTIAVLFQIAKRLFNEKTAWLSSLLLVFSFFHVVLAHWVRHWTFTAFFVYATFLSFLWLLEKMSLRGFAKQSSNDKQQDDQREIAASSLRNFGTPRNDRLEKLFRLLPGLLGGLGFGVSYLGGLGFFVGLVYLWFRRKEIASITPRVNSPQESLLPPEVAVGQRRGLFSGGNIRFWKIIFSNIAVFGLLCVVFALLNIQEVYRMVSPIDGSLSDPKSAAGLLESFRDVGLVLFRQEIVILILAVASLLLIRKYRKIVTITYAWLVVYVILIYGSFHLELRYVYLMVPALCLLAGMTLSYIHDFFLSLRVHPKPASPSSQGGQSPSAARSHEISTLPSNKLSTGQFIPRNDKQGKVFANAIIILIFLWPIASVAQYEILLLKKDTREQAVEWIQENISTNESFLISSETIVLPRTNEALVRDQEMGRIRASERYKINKRETGDTPLTPLPRGGLRGGGNEFQYYNLHFWRDDLSQSEIDELIRREKPGYFVVDYWGEDKLTDRERELMRRGRLVQRFKQSDLQENVDVNGNFFEFNVILFKLDRLGPIVNVYELSN